MENSWLLIATALLILYVGVVFNAFLWPLLLIGAPVAIYYMVMHQKTLRRLREIELMKMRAGKDKKTCSPQNIRPETERLVVEKGGVRMKMDGLEETVPLSDGMLNWHAQRKFSNGLSDTYYRHVKSSE